MFLRLQRLSPAPSSGHRVPVSCHGARAAPGLEFGCFQIALRWPPLPRRTHRRHRDTCLSGLVDSRRRPIGACWHVSRSDVSALGRAVSERSVSVPGLPAIGRAWGRSCVVVTLRPGVRAARVRGRGRCSVCAAHCSQSSLVSRGRGLPCSTGKNSWWRLPLQRLPRRVRSCADSSTRMREWSAGGVRSRFTPLLICRICGSMPLSRGMSSTFCASSERGLRSLCLGLGQQIAAVLSWAVAHGFRPDNPCDAALAAFSPPRRSETRPHPALPYADVPAAVRAASNRPLRLGARLLVEFLILTVVRSDAARGALWSEVDLEAASWTVPATRMPNGAEHRIPLSSAALAVLGEAREDAGLSEALPWWVRRPRLSQRSWAGAVKSALSRMLHQMTSAPPSPVSGARSRVGCRHRGESTVARRCLSLSDPSSTSLAISRRESLVAPGPGPGAVGAPCRPSIGVWAMVSAAIRPLSTNPTSPTRHEFRRFSWILDAGWVAAGSYPPAAPTVPGVPHSGTRLLR